MGEHSKIISGSTALRRIHCPGSSELEAQHPDTTSIDAARGTALHEAMRLLLGERDGDSPWDFVGFQEGPYKLTEDDVRTSLIPAIDATNGIFDHYGWDSEYIAEERFVMPGNIAPDQGGRIDLAVRAKDVFLVVDYKFGYQKVFAQENSQLSFYTGAMKFSPNADVQDLMQGSKTVVFMIVQPDRQDPDAPHMDVWETDWLYIDLFVSLVKKAYERIAGGDKTLKPGSWCSFCKARPTCPEQHKAIDGAIEMPKLEGITAAAAGELLRKVQIAKAAIPQIEAYFKKKLEDGASIPGWKLVTSRANREWVNESEAAGAIEAYLGEGAYERKLLSPAKVEGLIPRQRKKVFSEKFGHLVERVPKGLSLVPDTDKRPAASLQAASGVSSELQAALQNIESE